MKNKNKNKKNLHMKTTILKNLCLTSLLVFSLVSCVNDDDYGVPALDCTETTLVKTIEVSQVPASATVAQYTLDNVIEAYITSSDKGGNFFKSISFQTLDGSKAFSVPVDVTSTFINYEPGRKVLINLKNLYTDVSNGGVRIGSIFLNSSGVASVGRIPEFQYRQVLNRSCTVVPESQLVRTLTIPNLLNDANINTLIELDNVQFQDAALGKRFYDATLDVGGATNHRLTDANGNTVIFRTSSFANFASAFVPNESGKVRGVLTKFGSDYQILARTIDDVQLTNTRLDVDVAAPVGGSSIVYACSLNEGFTSFANNNTVFPSYINDPSVGTKYWRVNIFNNNNYLQMSSFSSSAAFQEQLNKSYFIVPVDFTCANSLAFKTQDRFNNGGVLKVYYTTDYVPLGNIQNATLTQINGLTIASGNTGSATQAFVNSGVFNFPTTLTGNGFVVFEYTGGYSFSPALTTTMHIDDIVIN